MSEKITWHVDVPPNTTVHVESSSQEVETSTQPTPQHNGKLDTREFSDGSHAECQIKQGGMVLEVSDSVGRTVMHSYLQPTQALSLLVWLEQERDTLERLAKEQEP